MIRRAWRPSIFPLFLAIIIVPWFWSKKKFSWKIWIFTIYTEISLLVRNWIFFHFWIFWKIEKKWMIFKPMENCSFWKNRSRIWSWIPMSLGGSFLGVWYFLRTLRLFLGRVWVWRILRKFEKGAGFRNFLIFEMGSILLGI